MTNALMRLIAVCALSAATRQMKMGASIGRVCSLCVIEALVEILASGIAAID